MIDATWSGFFTLMCVAVAFFFAGRLWEHETAAQEEERRATRRRAHRMRSESQR